MSSNFRTSVGTPTFESKYLEKESELKTLRLENLELKNAVKMKDLEIKEKGLTFRNSVIENSQLSDLKQHLESKDKTIKENERKIKDLEEKCIELEKDKNSAMELADSLKNSTNAPKTNKISEDFYKKKLEAMTEEVFNLKRQLEEAHNNAEMGRLELENEVSKLKIENAGLLRQKSEKTGPSSLRNANKFEDISNNNIEIQNMKEQIRNLDEEKKNLQNENHKISEKLAETEKEQSENIERMRSLEFEVNKTKVKLAEILNAAFETGGTELVELIENAIVDQRISISKGL